MSQIMFNCMTEWRNWVGWSYELQVFFLDGFNFLVGDELQTYTYVLLDPFESYAYAHCEYFVGWFKTKIVELTHLVAN